MNLSPRDRWLAALLPAIAVGAGYILLMKGRLEGELAAETVRLEKLKTTPPPAPPAAAAGNAEKLRAEVKSAKAEHDALAARAAELKAKLAAAGDPAAALPPRADPVAVVAQIERILKRHGLSPVLSAEATGAEIAALGGAPAALSRPKPPGRGGVSALPAGAAPPVWHLIADGTCARFRAALAELAAEIPSAVPLGLNLSYNPETENETRLLELWLLY